MKFSVYMHEWLYGEDGYYTKERAIGKQGDFYTSVSSSMFFGGAIAKRIITTIESGFLSPSSHIVEIGAHKGYLLADIIQFIYTLKPELLQTLTFVIVEPFSANQTMQKIYFDEAFGKAIALLHVKTLETFTCKEAFFVANEIFDAFACEVIHNNKMLFIENNRAIFKEMDEITTCKANEYGLKKGELCLGYEPFAASMAKSAERFEFVTFDYGQKGPRGDFSLRVFSQHHVFPFFTLTDMVEAPLREKENFSFFFAKSDLTYDVCFDHLIYAFEKVGVRVEKFAFQMKALVDFGLIDLLALFAQNVSTKAYEHEVNRIKPLIDPAFMGERFCMACFRKGEEDEINH